MGYAEERAALCRVAAGVRGWPTPADDWALAEWLGECVEVRQRVELRRAQYQRRPDGGCWIDLPLCADERRETCWLVEELAHYLCLADGPGPAGPWEGREEAEAVAFVAAWRLPAELVRACRDDAELLWESGCDPELVRRRLARLGDETLRGVPAWSAAREYVVERCRGPIPRVRARPRDGGPPCEWAGASDADLRRVQLDLLALTGPEFRLKHRAAIRAAWEPADWQASRLLPGVPETSSFT